MKLTDDLIDRAYQVAYFIHADKYNAFCVVKEAVLQHSTAAMIQGKRNDSYEPKRGRRIIILPEENLLQLLVYHHSGLMEEEQEKNGPDTLCEEDMVIRFIEFLVKASMKNSSYMVIAICKLLFAYSGEETRNIYERLVPDPNGEFLSAEDYSKRKRALINGLRERFGSLIEIIRMARNEEQLQRRSNPDHFENVVRNSLEKFTPWLTNCFSDKESQTTIEAKLWSKEESAELMRMHILIHCLERFTEMFKLVTPRLAIPQFAIASASNPPSGPSGNRESPPPLKKADFDLLKKEIEREKRRRKFSWASLLKIYVDGRERAEFDLNEQTGKDIQTDANAQIIEVRANGVPLATFFLPDLDALEDDDQPLRQAIKLEGGQKLSCDISVTIDSDGEVSGATLHVQHQETNPLRMAVRWLQRSSHQIARLIWTRIPAWLARPVFVSLLVLVAAVAIVKSSLDQQLATIVPPPPPPSTGPNSFTPDELAEMLRPETRSEWHKLASARSQKGMDERKKIPPKQRETEVNVVFNPISSGDRLTAILVGNGPMDVVLGDKRLMSDREKDIFSEQYRPSASLEMVPTDMILGDSTSEKRN